MNHTHGRVHTRVIRPHTLVIGPHTQVIGGHRTIIGGHRTTHGSSDHSSDHTLGSAYPENQNSCWPPIKGGQIYEPPSPCTSTGMNPDWGSPHSPSLNPSVHTQPSSIQCPSLAHCCGSLGKELAALSSAMDGLLEPPPETGAIQHPSEDSQVDSGPKFVDMSEVSLNDDIPQAPGCPSPPARLSVTDIS